MILRVERRGRHRVPWSTSHHPRPRKDRGTATVPSRLYERILSRAGDDIRTEVSMSQPKIVVGYVKSEEGELALAQAIKEAKIRNAALGAHPFRAWWPE